MNEKRDNLKENAEFLQSVFDGIGDAIKIVDKDFRIVFANNATGEMLGKSREELVGNKCFLQFHCMDYPPNYCPTSKALKSAEPQHAQNWITKPDGARAFIEHSAYPIKDGRGNLEYIIETITDATEKKMLEEQLIQSAKLAVLGESAAGIAHEVRSPLNAIMLGLQALKPYIEENEDTTDILSTVNRNVNRLNDFIRELLNFTKKEEKKKTPTDVNEIIERSMFLVRNQAKEQNIEITTELEKPAKKIMLDMGRIEQVLANVVLNAIQAMPEGGQLRIYTRRTEDQHMLIECQDTGHGISKDNLGKVFNPFFTTKVTGTGLGLSISYKIIKEHGGDMEIISEESKGTTVKIRLPIVTSKSDRK